jgi:hypothetical protein
MKGVFGSNAQRYTMPVYVVGNKTPMATVDYSGRFSEVTHEGRRVRIHKKGRISAPIPVDAMPAAGRDAQIIVWNPDTGEEWGFWRISRTGEGWTCTNLYKYNTRWKGVPPYGFLSRGAGIPYLTGLIRPWEIKQGRIEHAIAFGMDYPSRMNVPPATRSDGQGLFPNPPMGARFQLDPSLTEKDLRDMGLDDTGVIIARALQEYGMILIDSSGHPKIYAEYEGTAQWGKLLDKNTIRAIPYSALRLLDLRTPSSLPPTTLKQTGKGLSWTKVRFASRYRIERRCSGRKYEIVAQDIEGTSWEGKLRKGCEYVVRAVNYNGVGRASPRIRVK